MKIFVAGATGVIGRQLPPRLINQGHDVTAMTRSKDGAEQIRAWGAKPSIGDVFEWETLCETIVTARPEVVIHQLTSLPQHIDPRHVEWSYYKPGIAQ